MEHPPTTSAMPTMQPRRKGRPAFRMSRNRSVAYILLSLLMLARPAFAEDATIQLSLSDAISIGLRKNPNVQGAYLQRIADKFNLRVADDQFTPKLMLNSDYVFSRTPGSNTTGSGFDLDPVVTLRTVTGATVTLSWSKSFGSSQSVSTTGNNSVDLTVTQPLLQGGGVEAATAQQRIAHVEERINKLTLKSSVESTVDQIILSYRQFQLAVGQFEIAQSSVDATKSLLEMDKKLVQAGRMARLDLVQVQANIENQNLSVIQAKDQVETARLQLLQLLSLDQSSRISAVDTAAVSPVSFPLDPTLKLAFDNQTQYLQQALSIEQDKIQLFVAKDNRLWTLSVVGNVSHPLGFASSSQKLGYSAGLQLSIPIGDLTPEQGEVNAGVTLEQAQAQLKLLHNQVEQSIRNAVREVDVAWEELTVARDALKLSQQQLDIERKKLSAGRSSNFEVVSFSNALQAAQNTELSQRIGYLNALTNLDFQAGTILVTWKIQLNDGR